MSRRPARPLLVALAALVVAAVSIASAHLRAPSLQDQALATYVALGGDLADLCGDAGHVHDGSCPLCRLPGDAVPPGPVHVARADLPVERVERAAPPAPWRAAGRVAFASRAPPAA
jgi:hypothetical protein